MLVWVDPHDNSSIDCEQALSLSLFFSDLLRGVHVRERLSCLAPFITHVVVFVSGALSSTRNKRDSLRLNARRLIQTLSSQNKIIVLFSHLDSAHKKFDV